MRLARQRGPAQATEDPLSTTANPPNPPLPEDVLGEIGKHLQLTLVELVALALAGKQLQWSAYGPDFLSLYTHLDRVVGEWRELTDMVAERAATLGIPPDGSAAAVIELADLAAIAVGFTEVGHAREALCSQVWEVGVRIRQRAERLSELDRASAHVLIDVLRKLDEQLWMMRAQRLD
jgi:starvation-inducible DNA-binding protein